MGKKHHLLASVWLSRPIDEVFAFFADAMNLQRITPPFLHFRVLTPPPIAMAKGSRIDYRIALHGIPIRWRTEITAWEPPFRFIDEQLKGPYSLWRHEHTFRAEGGGTRCDDHVIYDAPGGPLIHALLVRPDLERIFRFRQRTMLEIFGGREGELSLSDGPLTSTSTASA